MANMRRLYEQRYPALAPQCWLPARFDHAVAGMATRLDELAPVYQLSTLVNLQLGAAKVRWTVVSEALAENPQILVLHQPVKKAFWARVRAHEFIAWELLTPAIVGVMSYGLCQPHAPVYDRSKVLELLAGAVRDDVDPMATALEDFQTKLLPLNAGDKSPWYFFR